VLENIFELIGKKPTFYNLDIRDISTFEKVFKDNPEIDGVVHFAAKKSV